MYLSLLSAQQKELFIEMVYHLAVADGNYSIEEECLISSYCQEMQITFSSERANGSFAQVIERIKTSCDLQNKKIMVFESIGLAMADTKFDQSERDLIRSAALQWDISQSFIARCEDFIREYLVFQEKLNALVLG